MQIPFALSLSKYLNSAGADAGFAAILAVALLVILYFAHARETKTLREHLEEAHDRIDALEGRIAQLLSLQSARPQAPAPPVTQRPAPATAARATARPMGSAVASLRSAPGAEANGNSDGSVPAAPYGVGAPALMSATHALPESDGAPEPARAVPVAVDDTMMAAPAAARVAGNGGRVADGAVAAAPAVTTAATAVGRGGRGAPPQAPPRVQIRPDGPAGPAARRPGQPPRGSLLDDSADGPHRGRRVLAMIGVVIAIVVVVFVVTKLTSGSNASSSSAGVTTAQKAAKRSKSKAAAFDPRNVTVAVLNGTSVAGLAKDVSQFLGKKGYRAGSITNAAVQTERSTIVYYIPHQQSAQIAAKHVADALSLRPSSVRSAPQSVIQSCSTTPSSSTSSCQGDVIVSVGSDRASLASGQSG